MTNENYEWGFYRRKIPYLIKREGEPSVIVFEPSRDLLKSVINRTNAVIKNYTSLLPRDCSFCILGYDQNLPAKYSNVHNAEDFYELIHEKYRRGIVLGISYGGSIAIPFAVLYPAMVQKLILMMSAYTVSQEGYKLIQDFIQAMESGNSYKVIQMFNSLHLRRLMRVVLHIGTWIKKKSLLKQENPPSTFINAYTYMLQTAGNNKKYLSQIQAPTLVIGGDKDQFVSKELFRETADLIPKGQLKLFKNSGHYVVLEKLKDVKKTISTFIRDTE